MNFRQVSLLLIDQQGLRHFTGISPCLPLAGGLCKFYANEGGKRPIQRQPLFVQYKQQANPLLSMKNYTSLVISGSDQNMPQTLLSQRKLTLTTKNTLFLLYKIIGAPKKYKNQPLSSI